MVSKITHTHTAISMPFVHEYIMWRDEKIYVELNLRKSKYPLELEKKKTTLMHDHMCCAELKWFDELTAV